MPIERTHRSALYQQEAKPSSTTYTNAVATQQALDFDLITCQVKSVKTSPNTPVYSPAQITLMKAANPRLKVCVYFNATQNATSSFAEAWYLHDANGSRCFNSQWGLYCMQLDNAGWISYATEKMLARFNGSTYDGVFLDVMGDFPLSFNPVHPGTTNVYTSGQWYALTTALAQTLRAALPTGKMVIGNGLGNGTKWPTSKVLVTTINACTGGMAETFVRTSTQTTDARPLSQWKTELVMLDDANTVGRDVLAATKDWSTATSATKTLRLKFAFFSFMLQDDGTNYFGCSTSQADTLVTRDFLSHTDYGDPLGPYEVNGSGIYTRQFTNSVIAVNPTTSSWTGTVGGTSVTLAPYRATAVMSPGSIPTPDPPANDNFSTAAVQSGVTGSVSGTLAGATVETGESNTASTWHRHVVASPGHVSLTISSSEACELTVATGTALDSLTTVTTVSCSAGGTATASYDAVTGTTYYWRVSK